MTLKYRALDQFIAPKPVMHAPEDDLWDDLCRSIKLGEVVPIVSHSIFQDLIFGPLIEQWDRVIHPPSSEDDANSSSNPPANGPANGAIAIADETRLVNLEAKPTVSELFAQRWANALGYPMNDRMVLARVAQFNLINTDSDEQRAKREFLTFVKQTMIDLVNNVDPNRISAVPGLAVKIRDGLVSDLASDLGLLSPPDKAAKTPLQILAGLPLPLYVTTSYYNYLERALEIDGRQVSTTPDIKPTNGQTVVYHLHGYESDPKSIVLSEDDYLEFFRKVTQPQDPNKPSLPLYLREWIAERKLLLLGFRLQEWDFLSTFHGVIKLNDVRRRTRSVAIQLSDQDQQAADARLSAEKYLRSYFDEAYIDVMLCDSLQFIRTLGEKWDAWNA